MDLKSVKWGAGVFISGALNRYVWIRPGFNSAGLQTLALGGLCAIAIQAVTFKTGDTVANKIKPLNNIIPDADMYFGSGTYFITVLASIPAAVSMARHWGIQAGYKEAASFALISTITNIVALAVLDYDY